MAANDDIREISYGFDQEAAAVLVTREAVLKNPWMLSAGLIACLLN
jgi:hypothetical protein